MASILGLSGNGQIVLSGLAAYTESSRYRDHSNRQGRSHVMDSEFLKQRIDATKALIVAYEDATTALVSGGVQSYTLDTGQSRQTVTRFDLVMLNNTLDSLYNRLVTLQARLDGGSVNVRPAW